MKKTYILSTIFALLMLFNFSCDDLEENQVGGLSPTAFSSTDDIMLAVNGGYSLLTHENFWGRKFSLSLLLRGDMATIGDMGTSGRRIEVDQMNMSATNGMVSAFWPMGYKILGAVNLAIDGSESIAGTEEEINAVVAEAMFLRAFIHYNFVRVFGEIPYMGESAGPNTVYDWGQSSEDEIYAGIIEDLEFAKVWLPDMARRRSRPGKGTAAAFLASVHLTRGDFQSAYDEAKFVIDNSGMFNYALEGEFADLFDPSLPSASNEVVFEIDFIGNDASTNPSSLGATNASTDYIASVTGPRGDARYDFKDGWSVAVPSLEVFNSWDARDYRRSVSFDTLLVDANGDSVSYTDWASIPKNVARPHIAKYFRANGDSQMPSGNNGRDSDIDYPIMRYAEVLLIAAEASNEVNGGPTAEALDFVNQVRARARRELDSDTSNDNAFPADLSTGLSQDDFRTAVLEERRLELAFEFGRWFDIKRRQMAETAFGTSGLEQQDFNPAKDYLFPKYQQDVDRLEKVTQNDGY